MPQLEKTKLRDLDASKITSNREYLSRVQIVGESSKKALPQVVDIYCPQCKAQEVVKLDQQQMAALAIEGPFGLQRRLAGSLQDPKIGSAEPACRHARAVILNQLSFADYRQLTLRDPPGYDDEELDLADFRTIKGHVVGCKVPSSKLVQIRERVTIEPRTRDLCLLIEEIEPADDEVQSFRLSEQDKRNFDAYFTHNIRLLENADNYFVPRLVGQTLRKQCMLLTLHSPCWIRLPDGSRIRGLLRMLVVGDTKTFKSKSLEWVFKTLRLGELSFAETSSRTGLLYGIDAENKTLTWGVLVRNDLGLCLIAGLHGINPDDVIQMREALEFLRVKVQRYVEAEASARTRIIGDSNPRRASMKEYVLSCEAIRDLPFFKGPPDVTRYDLFFVTREDDVRQEEINRAAEIPLSIPADIQRRHVLWSWSRKPEHIILSRETLAKVDEVTADLVSRYSSESLPIVHRGFKETILRLSVSMAAFTHSVDNTHELIIVRPEHAQRISDLLTWLYNENLELDKYVEEERGSRNLTDKDLEIIIKELGDGLDVLKVLRHGPSQSSVLAERLSVDETTIRKRAAKLKANELIRASRGRQGGYELAAKGVQIIRRLMPTKEGEAGKVKGGENLTIYSTNVNPAPQFTDATPISTDGGAGLLSSCLSRLRLHGPCSEDCLLDEFREIAGDMGRARACFRQLRNDGLIVEDPDGYWKVIR